jgi:hypothetical protein
MDFYWSFTDHCCICCTLLYLLYYVCIAGVTLDTELLARSQYSEGPATGHLDTGFSWFPYVYKQMLRWLLCFQVATTCFSCSPPDLKLNVSVASFIFLLHVKWPLPPGNSPIAVNKYYYIISKQGAGNISFSSQTMQFEQTHYSIHVDVMS